MSTVEQELERRRRRDGLTFARGSLRLEGFFISAEAEAIGERYVAGELTLDEFVAQVGALHPDEPGARGR